MIKTTTALVIGLLVSPVLLLTARAASPPAVPRSSHGVRLPGPLLSRREGPLFGAGCTDNPAGALAQ